MSTERQPHKRRHRRKRRRTYRLDSGRSGWESILGFLAIAFLALSCIGFFFFIVGQSHNWKNPIEPPRSTYVPHQ